MPAPSSPHFRSYPRRLGLFVLLVHLAGCYTWQSATGSLPEVLADDPPSRIRVELVDGTDVEVSRPLVFGDTLYAQTAGERPDAIAAVENVRYVDVPKTDAMATGFAVVGIPIVLLGALIAATYDGGFSR